MAEKREIEVKEENILRKGLNLKKSNLLISSKYRASLLENKIVTLSLSKIELDGSGRPVAKLTAKEIMDMLGKKNTSIYSQIKKAAQGMAGRQMLIEDKENKRFALINLIGSAYYENGELLVKFEPDLKNLVYDIKKNYTPIDVPLMMKFKSNYSYRLYELLKSKAYDPNKKRDADTVYEIPFKVSELKITIGLVDTNVEAVKVMMQKENPDYDEILEKAPIQNFPLWIDFKSKVLDVAIEEINERSDIEVSYKLNKIGRGGRVDKIFFYVRRKDVSGSTVDKEEDKPVLPTEATVDVVVDITPDELLDLIDEVLDFIDEPIKSKDARNILKAANYDIKKVKKAYLLSQDQENISNLVGWLIAAIKNDYNDTKIPKVKGMDYETVMEYQDFRENLEKEWEKDGMIKGW